MPITIRCSSDDCDQWHTLADGEYERQDGGTYASLYRSKCPSCRQKFDDMLAAMKRFEEARERDDRLRERAEELVRDYAAPPAMAAAIVDLVRAEAGLTGR